MLSRYHDWKYFDCGARKWDKFGYDWIVIRGCTLISISLFDMFCYDCIVIHLKDFVINQINILKGTDKLWWNIQRLSHKNYYFSKGDGHLKFSGQPRTLLRNLASYNGQILHDGRFFVKDLESTKVEAIQPP